MPIFPNYIDTYSSDSVSSIPNINHSVRNNFDIQNIDPSRVSSSETQYNLRQSKRIKDKRFDQLITNYKSNQPIQSINPDKKPSNNNYLLLGLVSFLLL
jgi:hypothetical protein